MKKYDMNAIVDKCEDIKKRNVLKAIEGSIEKWQNIVYHGAIDNGVEDCPLCVKFCAGGNFDGCFSCPLMEMTKKPLCMSTPYDGCNHLPQKEWIVNNNKMLSFLYEIRLYYIIKNFIN